MHCDVAANFPVTRMACPDHDECRLILRGKVQQLLSRIAAFDDMKRKLGSRHGQGLGPQAQGLQGVALIWRGGWVGRSGRGGG